MGQYGPANLDLLRRTTRLDFMAELGVAQAQTIYNAICMDLDSDSDQETMAFFGSLALPERVDRRGGVGGGFGRKALNDYSYTIVNATWKSIHEVEKDLIMDAKLNQIKARAQSQADVAQSFLDQRMTTILEANGNGYDLAAYFSAVHFGQSGDAAYDNDITSAIVAKDTPTIAEFETIFGYALRILRGLKDDKGNIWNHGNLGLVCMVSPGWEGQALSVLEVGPVPGTSTSSGVWKNKAKVMVNPYMSTTDVMYLFATARPIKPLIYQKREEWEFKLYMEGDAWEKENLGAMISDARFEFGLGQFLQAVKYTSTTA